MWCVRVCVGRVCGVGVCRLCGRGGGVEIVKYVCVCVKGGSEVYQSI